MTPGGYWTLFLFGVFLGAWLQRMGTWIVECDRADRKQKGID